MKKSKKTKKSVPRTTKHEIVVRVQNDTQRVPALTEADLTPVQEGGKYMIPKTWLSEKQALKIIQKTPPQYILKRKGRGNQMFDYIPGHYFKKILNYTFGWNWDFRIVKQEILGEGKPWGQVVTTGELTVKDDHGHSITKADNGKADIKLSKETKNPMDIGNDFKASATDCLKRCAAQLGIGSDVYGKMDIKNEIDYEVGPSLPPPSKIAPKGEFADAITCSECDGIMTAQERDFSVKVYKKQLCRNCQKNHKK